MSSRYTFHYRISFLVNVNKKASRARQRKWAVSGGCPISSMVTVIIYGQHLVYRELNFVRRISNSIKIYVNIKHRFTSRYDFIKCWTIKGKKWLWWMNANQQIVIYHVANHLVSHRDSKLEMCGIVNFCIFDRIKIPHPISKRQ